MQTTTARSRAVPVRAGGVLATSVRASRPGSSFVLEVDSLAVEPGEFVALIGPSGSGKSTLLDVTAGLVPFQRGDVRVAGLDLSRRAARRAVRRVGCYLSQQGTVVDHLSVVENLDLSVAIAGQHIDGARRDAAIERMGLSARRGSLAAQLSGGQRQRVALASALYRRSPVVWADEPTSALDEENSARVFESLKEMTARDGAAVLCVTHDVAQVRQWADRLVTVADGLVREDR